jgi:hypothetical protein
VEEILNSNIIVNKKDIKTHKKIKFKLDKDAEILKLEFDYFPKVVKDVDDIINAFNGCSFTEEEVATFKDRFIKGEEELKNLATLSLYYGDEYVGCAHRPSKNETIVISEKESSAGFINTSIKKGQWEIVISLHAVFTDNMKLSIKAYI